MFARRVFELALSNTNIISNYSKGMKNIFKNNIHIIEENEFPDLNNNFENKRIENLYTVLKYHTYYERWKYILDTINFPYKEKINDIEIIFNIENSKSISDIEKKFNRITYSQKKLVLINIVSKNNFEFCYIIGKGGFGKVWKVQHKTTKKFYALKEMSKMKIIIKKSENSVNFEKEILSKLHNNFIVNMYYAFQDKDNLYLVMDYLKGGDLRFHLTRHIKFSEEQSRFFICNIITALEYIHSKNIIHRDIKPENLVLEEQGYARLTDFGIARKNKDGNKGDTSGTPGYMAPEVMRGGSHSFEVDFFAIGIIGYEFMKGKRPYNGKNRKEIRDQILMKQIYIKNEEIEDGWTKESVDFINKLLIRKKENRLGYKGINEVKEHPWIKYYPWSMIVDKTLPSPFIPQNNDNFDLRYCARTEKIGEETKMRYEELILENKFKNIFNNFLFNYDYEQKLLLKMKEKEKTNINLINKNVINNIYNRVNKYNFDFNSLNDKYNNNKASYKQLPNYINKIIIDIKKDKYNTINDMDIDKKLDKNIGDESLYETILERENMKINNIFQKKINNNIKKINKKNNKKLFKYNIK